MCVSVNVSVCAVSEYVRECEYECQLVYFVCLSQATDIMSRTVLHSTNHTPKQITQQSRTYKLSIAQINTYTTYISFICTLTSCPIEREVQVEFFLLVHISSTLQQHFHYFGIFAYTVSERKRVVSERIRVSER